MRQASEQSIVWTIWLVYGAFYFCRTNLGVAAEAMKLPVLDGGLGLTGEQVGWILASLKITYGVGQLLNGQIAEFISPRKLLAIGMFGSAALNVCFGFSTGFYFLLFLWAMNGYCQSLGWPPSVRVIGNWVPVSARGRALGIVGTGYQITLGLTYFVAGMSVSYFGWRGAVFIPAAMLAAVGMFMLVALRDAPEAGAHRATSRVIEARSVGWQTVMLTFTNPALWLLGFTLGLLNACRYGFIDWGVAHLTKVQGAEISKAALQYVVLAIGAAAGSYLTGWATDRFFGGRRAPVMVGLLVLLAALTIAYEYVSQISVPATVFLLMLIGFCIFGPQVLLVGTAPADLAKRGTPAAAAGFVNFLGYMGASAGDVITGYFTDMKDGWQTAIYVWAGWALLAACLAAILWNAAPEREAA
ncbi:MAG: MFS transporter [Pirellulales bacterium]|nr:MFS transporter [Pirellulales bacterium]